MLKYISHHQKNPISNYILPWRSFCSRSPAGQLSRLSWLSSSPRTSYTMYTCISRPFLISVIYN